MFVTCAAIGKVLTPNVSLLSLKDIFLLSYFLSNEITFSKARSAVELTGGVRHARDSSSLRQVRTYRWYASELHCWAEAGFVISQKRHIEELKNGTG